ncbi:MAG: 30S ribosomal protein S12 methylthiotransferase RimO [Defluviitaleaceae bacterium]|nr:30S ribosomal protein S12 methylthiotransferase RimO [Defluviitaleaceae bacterium]MCL2274846.1 30S ribosomal protein S12 methylthiotransferase RimO [Defluviitaleaceae bacterium]
MSNLVYLLSLGCDKNKIDGEEMLGRLLADGFENAEDSAEAHVIIVNTCGFIREAVQESIDLILEMAALKKTGVCKALVVVGCMTERYRKEMTADMPEVDAILGVADRESIVPIVREALKLEPCPTSDVLTDEKNRVKMRLLARKNSAHPHIAHVKIAEGCDNHCTYCTIPAIRGGYKSRPSAEIIEECRMLMHNGVREIVLVAQDTAQYGKDLPAGENGAKPALPALLREIDTLCNAAPAPIWVRLLYAYPEHITPELIQALATLPSLCKYLDMPIQHSETSVLARMGRSGTRENLKALIQNLRNGMPDITLRTTIMVGFPGETAAEFNGLFAFIEEMQFDRLGVFPYSQEAGTPAAQMPRQVTEATKQKRRDRIMQAQQEIHQAKQQGKIGKPLPVMVDDADPSGDDNHYVGRTQGDAFEVDACVYFATAQEVTAGDILTLTPISCDEYDLFA